MKQPRLTPANRPDYTKEAVELIIPKWVPDTENNRRIVGIMSVFFAKSLRHRHRVADSFAIAAHIRQLLFGDHPEITDRIEWKVRPK